MKKTFFLLLTFLVAFIPIANSQVQYNLKENVSYYTASDKDEYKNNQCVLDN